MSNITAGPHQWCIGPPLCKNCSNYPLEFTELHRLPPVEIGRKTAPTTPSNLRNFIDYPLPSKSAGKLLQQLLPPRIYGTSSTTPLLAPLFLNPKYATGPHQSIFPNDAPGSNHIVDLNITFDPFLDFDNHIFDIAAHASPSYLMK